MEFCLFSLLFLALEDFSSQCQPWLAFMHIRQYFRNDKLSLSDFVQFALSLVILVLTELKVRGAEATIHGVLRDQSFMEGLMTFDLSRLLKDLRF